MFGNTDKPVENIENDTFGISRYINGLCTFILHCETPMTISIQGDWGSGKTSMMNMVRSKIEDSVHSIWFNTWQFSQFQMQDNLAISMLGSLLSELDFYLKTDYAVKTAFLNFALYSKKPSAPQDLFELFGNSNGYSKAEWGYKKNNAFSFIDADNAVLDELYQKIKSEIEFVQYALAAE